MNLKQTKNTHQLWVGLKVRKSQKQIMVLLILKEAKSFYLNYVTFFQNYKCPHPPSLIFLPSALPKLNTILCLIFGKVSKIDGFNENFSFFSHCKKIRLSRAVGMYEDMGTGPDYIWHINYLTLFQSKGGGADYALHYPHHSLQYSGGPAAMKKKRGKFMRHIATDC